MEIFNLGVVGLATACQRIDDRGIRLPAINRADGRAVRRIQQRRVAFGSEIDFLVPVAIEINRGRILVASRTMSEAIRNRLRFDERTPQRGSQVRRIQSPKNSMPVRVVALRAKHQGSGKLPTVEKGLLTPAAGIQCTHLVRYVEHLFMQKI